MGDSVFVEVIQETGSKEKGKETIYHSNSVSDLSLQFMIFLGNDIRELNPKESPLVISLLWFNSKHQMHFSLKKKESILIDTPTVFSLLRRVSDFLINEMYFNAF